MMRRFLIALSALAIPAAAVPASAQDDDPFRTAARETPVGPYDPMAVLFVSGAFGNPADSFTFYSYWVPPSPATAPGRHRAYAVRKASRTASDVLWATSAECPALNQVLVGLEAIPSPRIDVPGIGEEAGPGLVLDGVTYDLWTRWPAWPGGTGYSLRMSGNVNTPLKAWADTLYRDLEPCWNDRPPLSR